MIELIMCLLICLTVIFCVVFIVHKGIPPIIIERREMEWVPETPAKNEIGFKASEEDSEETVDVDEEEPDTEEETIETVKNDKKEYKEMTKTYNIESPCVIEPGEFGEVDYYEQVYLTYYSNGVITNDISGDVVTDIDELIGVGSLDDIGKYEDDILHVRNDE